MAQVLPQYKGRADGKVINEIVREELQAGDAAGRSPISPTGCRPR